MRPEIGRLDQATRRAIALAEVAGLDLNTRPLLRDADFVGRLRARIGAPATLTVIGQVAAGKSSFVNSLVGQRLLPTSSRPTDGVISVLMYAPTIADERAERVGLDGSVEPFPTVADGQRFVDRAHARPADQAACREVRFYLYHPLLQSLRVVNTPGLGDSLDQFERVALDYVRADESDLIAWIFFPDAAANHDEIRTFATALERRRDAVLGVVSRCLDGHEDDPGFDPRQDPALAEVAGKLRAELGDYLAEMVLYDSRVAEDLIGRLRDDPELATDETFAAELNRCGYRQVEEAIEAAALRPGAQVVSLLKRCSATTRSLASAVVEAEQKLTDRARQLGEAADAWLTLNRDVLEPARTALLGDLTPVADRYAGELADTIATVSCDVLTDGFTLGKVLGNKAFRHVVGAQPLAEQLTERIRDGVDAALAERRFERRLEQEYERVSDAHLRELDLRLKREVSGSSRQGLGGPGGYDLGRPVAGADGVVDKAMAPAVARLVSGLASGFLSAAGKGAAKHGADAAAAGAAAAATGTAVKAGADHAAKAGARAAGGATFAKVLTLASLALVPFDIKKMIKEFGEGKAALVSSIQAKYRAERGHYAQSIESRFAEAVDETWAAIRSDLAAALAPADAAAEEVTSQLVEAAQLRRELAALHDTFDRAAS